jgi:DNA-directed RNA polymerase subunit beta
MAGIFPDDNELGVLGSKPTSVQPVGLVTSMPTPTMRGFDDIKATRAAIFGGIHAAASALPPLTNQRHTLSISDIGWSDPEEFKAIKKQKEAILKGNTLSRGLQGTINLTDNATGQVIDSRRTTIAKVPYLTDRGTYILNGTEYTLANQMRLRPGVFTRITNSGDVESHVNVMPGKGVSHRYSLNPEKSIFNVSFGQASIPLMPLLKAMGASDKSIREAWGNDVYAANAVKDDPKYLDKIYSKIGRPKPGELLNEESKRKSIFDTMSGMEMDPDVTSATLGQPFKNVSADSILAATRRILAIHKKEADPDDRDAMAYQNMYGPEDLFAERMKSAYKIMRPMLWASSFKKNLSSFSPGFLTSHLNSAITSSGLGQPLEEVNPADLLNQVTRVSRLGEGGIPSLQAVPEEARNVQPSHFGFIDPLLTPESLKVGVDSRVAINSRKGIDGKVYSSFRDVKTGKDIWKTPQELSNSVIAFPNEMLDKTKTKVAALVGGKIKYVDRASVEYELPKMENAFNHLANMIPLKSATKGQRVMMGARMLTQALPIHNAEAPFVQSGMPNETDKSYEEAYGKHMGAIHSDVEGQVIKVDDDGVHIRGKDGKMYTQEIYNNLPFNRKTFLHNTPVVKVGDVINKGSLLAKSNYTDDKGTAALGLNLRTAYIPYKGHNFEDAIVISEGAAKRLTSVHMYQHEIEHDKDTKQDKKSFLTLFPSEYEREVVDRLDNDGVIKPGSVVRKGDPILFQAKMLSRAHNQQMGRSKTGYSNNTVTWDHENEGIVTDVAQTKNGTSVTVKSLSQMKEGDKLSGRYGDKGVIAHVVPEDKMPRDSSGRPFEVLLNPLGVITRTNPSQMIETALGKIAEKTGKRYAVKDFDTINDLTEYAINELKKHNLSDLEDIEDPETGKKIKGIFTGSRYFLKLHHTSESKGQGRGTGSGYTAEETPAKGGEEGSKRVSLMDVNALLSHGAHEVIRDAAAIRGQKNEDYWAAFMSGKSLPIPRVPLTYRKFMAQLQAAGINPVRNGSKTQLMAMTDKDVDTLSGNREIKRSDTVDWDKGLEPAGDGLFDVKLTGGHGGTNWSHVKLHEPMPNPVMEDPIRRVLGLTEDKFRNVLSGTMQLQGASGPGAIKNALRSINVDQEIMKARAVISSGRKSYRDDAVRKLAYLKSAKDLKIHPSDWVMSKVPVLPPLFRPVSVMTNNGLPMVGDANYLYKELIDTNNEMKEASKSFSDIGDHRLALYDAFKAVTGLGDTTNPKLEKKGVKGILKQVFGDNPKFGTLQRKLLGSQVDMVGRAAITPNPELDMDEVGLPEDRAWSVYKPFIMRRLIRRGVDRFQAADMIEKKNSMAKDAMLAEMDARPVIITRAPILHRYGTMAFRPKLVKGSTLQVPPIIVKGFNADFDGDAMNYHVPSTDEAVKDAMEKMLPSRNLFAAKSFKVHQLPANEYQGGLYTATSVPTNRPEKYFKTKADAIRAYRSGEIEANDKVVIMELK